MARKPLSIREREQKQQFDKAVKKYGVKAIQNIINIAEHSLDARTKLHANEFLVEKAVGKDYKAFEKDDEMERDTHNITINLITEGKSYVVSEQDEKEIQDIENEDKSMLCDDTEDVWEIDDDDWGNEIYDP